jgi:hypothetical protein
MNPHINWNDTSASKLIIFSEAVTPMMEHELFFCDIEDSEDDACRDIADEDFILENLDEYEVENDVPNLPPLTTLFSSLACPESFHLTVRQALLLAGKYAQLLNRTSLHAIDSFMNLVTLFIPTRDSHVFRTHHKQSLIIVGQAFENPLTPDVSFYCGQCFEHLSSEKKLCSKCNLLPGAMWVQNDLKSVVKGWFKDDNLGYLITAYKKESAARRVHQV